MTPTRRCSSRISQPPQTKKEEKPTHLIDSGKEDKSESNEKFYFSFAEDGLTARECAQKVEEIKSKEEFLSAVPQDEITRFLTKAIVGLKRPIKCFDCERVYASASGLLAHLKKCEISGDPSVISARYREKPFLWLKVANDEKEIVLGHIVGANYDCFAPGCSDKFSNSKDLITHLDSCLDRSSEYSSYEGRPNELRQLDPKIRGRIIREALKNGPIGCLTCGREFAHSYGLTYHIERCQVDEAEKPWKCHRCGFKATTVESSSHLAECGQKYESKVMEKFDSLFVPAEGTSETADDDDEHPILAKKRRSAGPRVTQRKDGSTLYRYRKSTVNREFNGVVTVADQRKYEKACSAVFEAWKASSSASAFCERLQKVNKSSWTRTKLQSNDVLLRSLTRQSVTVLSHKVGGLQTSVPSSGVRVDALETAEVGAATVAFCGAPINSIRVAPGKMANEDDVICVCTFGNETDLETSSSIVQFWRHRTSQDGRSQLELWFLLHLPNRGTVLSMSWLQKNVDSEHGLIGFSAFSTSNGQVLIYRIDDNVEQYSTSDGVTVMEKNPDVVLTLGKLDGVIKEEEVSVLNATIKIEGEEIPAPNELDTSAVPIIRIAWSPIDGGRLLAGIDALGHILLWDLNSENSNCLARRIEREWQSPPSDVSWIDKEHLVVAFRERLVRMININDWTVTMEDNTMKTAGTRVHTDSRLVDSFFTFRSEYMSFPYPNATGVAYIGLDNATSSLVIMPTGNTHQLMTWDVALSPSLGTLISCGVDGRLVASATGRLLPKGGTFFANRNVISLRRRRILKDQSTFEELLKEVKQENSNSKEAKENLEESVVEHDDVCSKLWLEVTFDEPFSPARPELSCRDQRIESLSCVDCNTDSKFPVSFTGGEAGLLFAVPTRLVVEELEI